MTIEERNKKIDDTYANASSAIYELQDLIYRLKYEQTWESALDHVERYIKHYVRTLTDEEIKDYRRGFDAVLKCIEEYREFCGGIGKEQ